MLLDLGTTQWLVIIFTTMLIGLSRAGITGVGMLAMPLVVLVLPARQANGFILPLLIFADIFAIIYWRRHVNWHQLFRILPWTVIGIVVGFFCLGKITDAQLLPLLGLIILILLLLNLVLETQPRLKQAIPHALTFAACMGILTGIVSMLAHIGGPLLTIYLLALRFDKHKFIGTSAWFFWIINLIKMPFSSKLGLIDSQSLLTNLALIPCLILGAFIGIAIVHRVSQKRFNQMVYLLAFAAGIYLCLKPRIFS